MTKKQAKALRNKIEKMAESISDNDIIDYPELCPAWKPGVGYDTGERIQFEGAAYKCLQAHTSQATWYPGAAPSLWAKIINDGVPEWVQPDSTNPYMKGDKVRYKGEIYISLIDNNVWSPENYPVGWEKVSE